MPTSHSIQPLPAVRAYARVLGLDSPEALCPVVVQHFDGRWVRHPWRKRISRSYAERLRREGVTAVGLEVRPGGCADFRLAELLARPAVAMKAPAPGRRAGSAGTR